MSFNQYIYIHHKSMVVHPMLKHAEIIWEMYSLEYKQLGQSSAKNMGIYGNNVWLVGNMLKHHK